MIRRQVLIAIAVASLLAVVLSARLALAQTGGGSGGVERPVAHIRYEPPTSAPKVGEEQAIQAAKDRMGPRYSRQATKITARYVLFSNDAHHETDAHGRSVLSWQRIPAWVVTFEGLNYQTPGQGYIAARGGPSRHNTEVNIVIDATTGAFIQGFTYR